MRGIALTADPLPRVLVVKAHRHRHKGARREVQRVVADARSSARSPGRQASSGRWRLPALVAVARGRVDDLDHATVSVSHVSSRAAGEIRVVDRRELGAVGRNADREASICRHRGARSSPGRSASPSARRSTAEVPARQWATARTGRSLERRQRPGLLGGQPALHGVLRRDVVLRDRQRLAGRVRMLAIRSSPVTASVTGCRPGWQFISRKKCLPLRASTRPRRCRGCNLARSDGVGDQRRAQLFERAERAPPGRPSGSGADRAVARRGGSRRRERQRRSGPDEARGGDEALGRRARRQNAALASATASPNSTSSDASSVALIPPAATASGLEQHREAESPRTPAHR